MRIVGVLRPVQRGDHIWRRRVDARWQLRCREFSALDGVTDPETDVDHDVADEHRPIGEPLVGKVPHGLLGRRQEQVGRVVGEHPVVLLRHPAVERPQTGLEVSDRECILTAATAAASVEFVSP